VQGVGVAGESGAEADLDAGADWPLRRLHAEDGRRAVALGTERDAAIAGDDGEGALRGEDGASDDAQAVAERATGRQPQELGRDHRAVNAEEAGDVLGVDAGAVVVDEVAAVLPTTTVAPGSSPLSASSFITSRVSLCLGTPAFCDSPSTVRKSVQSSRSNFKN
jgi:hypothetical protein